MNRPRIMICFGTRPEAIKMFPVVQALRQRTAFDIRIAVTAQHREMLDQVMEIAGITPDFYLDLMEAGQSLDDLAARIITRFGKVLDTARPNRVLVHGDTLTTMMVTLACYFRHIPVGHVEAGLRSGNIYSPWPEEANSRVASAVADLHFAPTEGARQALLDENVDPEKVIVTGNTVLDALLATKAKIAENPALASTIRPVIERFSGKRIVAVTAHRRENFGHGMEQIANAILGLAQRDDVALIYPLHPNPDVANIMRPTLSDIPNIALIEPLDYPNFVALMDGCDLILTDNGGIQEEAPSLGKPVLVMRDTTERPEAVAAGSAKLVGTDCAAIMREANTLLDDDAAYAQMAQAINPFGTGQASHQIADIIEQMHPC